MGKNQTLRQQKEPCGWGLLQLPDQGEPIEETFLLQLQEASCSQAPVLLGDFSHLDIYWESTKAGCGQSRELLQCMENSFLSQVIALPEAT